MLYLDLNYLHYFKNYSGLVSVKRKQSYCKKDFWLNSSSHSIRTSWNSLYLSLCDQPMKFRLPICTLYNGVGDVNFKDISVYASTAWENKSLWLQFCPFFTINSYHFLMFSQCWHTYIVHIVMHVTTSLMHFYICTFINT